MAKKQAVKNDVVVDVVADVAADEQTVESTFPYSGLMLTPDDMALETNVIDPETGKRLTIAEFVAKCEDSRQSAAIMLGLYRSTQDTTQITEYIAQRDKAIVDAKANPANLPEAIVSTIVSGIESAFNKAIKGLSVGENNALALLQFVRTGNVPGSKSVRHGALPDWTESHKVMLHSAKNADYLVVSAGALVKGKCPEHTTWASEADWLAFRIRGGKIGKVENADSPTKAIETTGIGYEYAGTFTPSQPPTPSGINKSLQTMLKGVEMSVNGWQGLYIPEFAKGNMPEFVK